MPNTKTIFVDGDDDVDFDGSVYKQKSEITKKDNQSTTKKNENDSINKKKKKKKKTKDSIFDFDFSLNLGSKADDKDN